MGKRGPHAIGIKNTQADIMNLDNAFPDVNFEVDFDGDDFDFMAEDTDDSAEVQAQENVRILRPRLDGAASQQCDMAMFENAEEFAKQICLEDGIAN